MRTINEIFPRFFNGEISINVKNEEEFRELLVAIRQSTSSFTISMEADRMSRIADLLHFPDDIRVVSKALISFGELRTSYPFSELINGTRYRIRLPQEKVVSV